MVNATAASSSVDEATCARVIVRNLPRSFTAEALSALFSPAGTIEEPSFVSANRRLSGKFGFVTFTTHAAALAAIEKFNGKTLESQGREGGLTVELATKPKASPKEAGEGASAAAASGGAAAATNSTRPKKGRGRQADGAAATNTGAASAAAPSSGNAAAAPRAARGDRQRRPRGAPRGRADSASGPQPAAAEAEPSNRVLIRNLPRSFTAEQLTELVNTVAPLQSPCFVSSNRRLNGQFAFVVLADVDAAARVIKELAGRTLEGQGRPGGLMVQYASENSSGNNNSGSRRQRSRQNSRSGRTRGRSAQAQDATTSEPPPPAARLFVRNLPPTFTAENFKELMAQAGKVADECFVSANRRLSGKFGFVLFNSVEEATKALEQFNGKELEGQGRPGGLVVQYARVGQGVAPSSEGGAAAASDSGAGGRGRGRGSRRGRGRRESSDARAPRPRRAAAASAAPASTEPPAPSHKIVVKNLPRSFTAEEISSLFSKVGKIVEDIFVSDNARLSGRFAFIAFENATVAASAIEQFKGKVFDGQGREGGLDIQFSKGK